MSWVREWGLVLPGVGFGFCRPRKRLDAGGALDPGPGPQETVRPQEPELDLGVCLCVSGGARETDLTHKCGRAYTQSRLTKEGPMRTGSKFPVPGEPGTGKSWRWVLWLPPTPGHKSETQEVSRLRRKKSRSVASRRPGGT